MFRKVLLSNVNIKAYVKKFLTFLKAMYFFDHKHHLFVLSANVLKSSEQKFKFEQEQIIMFTRLMCNLFCHNSGFSSFGRNLNILSCFWLLHTSSLSNCLLLCTTVCTVEENTGKKNA